MNRLTQDISLVAGCTLGFVIPGAVVLHHAVSGGSVDWAALAAWFTGFVILGSAIFAKQQVDAFKVAERNRHTLEQISKYISSGTDEFISQHHNDLSLDTCATSVLRYVDSIDGNLPMLRTFLTRLARLAGFFDESNSFLRRGIIDADLYMENLNQVTLMAYIIFSPCIRNMEPSSLRGFEALARDSQAYYIRHGGKRPEYTDFHFPTAD